MTAEYEELSLRAANAIAAQLKAKPDSCLGLPSGNSPLGCYKILSKWTESGQIDWSHSRCFALDDYLDAEETKTFASFLHENLYKHINLPLNQRFNPRFVDNYDALIAGAGGLDLTMIGIGRNGHIAFNEPGTLRDSWTHCVWLDETTRKQNANFFGSVEQVPKRAVTMGLETIMSSRKLVLIVAGEHKRTMLKQAMSGVFTPEIPASCLKSHPSLDVLADFPL